MDGKLKKGSPALFFVIKMCNLAFGVSAVALVAIAVWLWV